VKKYFIMAMVISLVTTLIIPTSCAQPAEFELSSLNVSPPEVVEGEPTTVTADVRNVGESKGTYSANLRIDGVDTETKEVTVAAGATERVTFTVTRDISRTYRIELDGLSGTLKVLKPAEFTISNLRITPDPVQVGDQVTVTVSVKNTGDIEGTHTVCLTQGLKVTQRQDITLAGGTSGTVSFTISHNDYSGNYVLEVDGLEATYKVVLPTFSLAEAVEQELVEAEIFGTGACAGDSIILRIRRTLPRTIDIIVTPGTVLISSNPAIQAMIIRRLRGFAPHDHFFTVTESIYLNSDEAEEYLIEAYCRDFQKGNPTPTTRFSIADTASAEIMDILEASNEIPEEQTSIAAIQVAIWVVTEDISHQELAQRFRTSPEDLDKARGILQAAGIDPQSKKLFAQ